MNKRDFNRLPRRDRQIIRRAGWFANSADWRKYRCGDEGWARTYPKWKPGQPLPSTVADARSVRHIARQSIISTLRKMSA